MKKNEILRRIKESAVAKLFTLLFFLMIFQIFNPVQGSILIGLGGAKFWLIPMFWFYFAFLFHNEEKIKSVFYIIFIIGVITAIYGIKQGLFGFANFELKWIYAKMEIEKFRAITIHSFIRPISTFASPQEYGNYILISFLVSSGFFLKKIRLSFFLLGMLITL